MMLLKPYYMVKGSREYNEVRVLEGGGKRMATQTCLEVGRSSRPVDVVKEQEWLARHKGEYISQYIVLDGGRLIGHGIDPRPFVAQARAEGVKAPFVHFIDDNSEPFVGGWL